MPKIKNCNKYKPGNCLERIEQGFLVCHIWTVNEKKQFECVMCKTPKNGHASSIKSKEPKSRLRPNRSPSPTTSIAEEDDDSSSEPEATSVEKEPTNSDDSPERKYFCGFCGVSFLRRAALSKHTCSIKPKNSEPAVVKAPSPNECKYCNESFASTPQMKFHLKTHTGPRPYLCKIDLCNRTFITRHMFLYHQRTMHKMYRMKPRPVQQCIIDSHPIECNYCTEKFTTSELLKSHLKTHSGPKPYLCRICNRNLSTRHMLMYHQRTKHKIYRMKPRSVQHCSIKQHSNECNFCTETFSSAQLLKSHLKSHSGPRPYLCRSCNRNFTMRNMLLYHQRTKHKIYRVRPRSKMSSSDDENRRFPCDVCGKRWQSLANLKRHLETHNRTKQKNPISEMEFSNSETFTSSQLLKSNGPRPYLCKKCNRNFNTRHMLLYHRRTMHRVRPQSTLPSNEEQKRRFLCDVCGKRWQSRAHLKRHLETHNSSKKKYLCPFCQFKFSNVKVLYTHISSRHKDA